MGSKKRVVFVNTVGENDVGVNAGNTVVNGNTLRDDGQETRFLLAATLIVDAQCGRTLPYHEDLVSLRKYREYDRKWCRVLTIIVMWFNLALALFERPTKPSLLLPIWATMIMEALCLVVFSFRLWQMYQFVPRKRFLYDSKNIVLGCTIIITVIDMIVHIAMVASGLYGLRISRFLRPLFLINMNESRQIRRAFRNIRNTCPEIFSVMVLFFSSIALFALMAFKFFEFRDLYYRTGDPYFVNYWDSYWDLYVLVTTANSPDVMMPAYDYSAWFMLFFIPYIILNTYIFMNLILAVIYNSYKKNLKKEVVAAINQKRNKLEKAFGLLSDKETSKITYDTWKTVLQLLTSSPNTTVILLMWQVLHDNSTTTDMTLDEFLLAADALNVQLVEDGGENNIFGHAFPKCYYSKPVNLLIIGVQHRFFTYFIDFLIVANALCIGFNLEKTEWFFLSVFMVEIILRIFSQGPYEYFSRDRFWNWFDFIIITAAFIGTIIEASLDELGSYTVEFLDFLMILRCLRLIKIVDNIDSFRTVVMTIVSIAPSLLTYGGVLVLVYYVFAIIGMELFAGKVEFNPNDPLNCGNELLEGSEFSRMGYCNNNFNDLLHTYIVLFELTVVNQWHVITHGYVLTTSKAARLYFISFNIITVLLIMNIIVAFVLEAFMLEYSPGKKTIEDKTQAKITELRLETNMNVRSYVHDQTILVTEEAGDENATYVGRTPEQSVSDQNYRFRINPGYKNIEALLQRMFEPEVVFNQPQAQTNAEGDAEDNNITPEDPVANGQTISLEGIDMSTISV